MMFKRPPDFIIGVDPNAPYLRRWWVIPRNKTANLYYHQILRSDTDEALHDHPWHNISVILSGGYWEWTPDGARVWRGPGSVVFRRAEQLHRLEVDPSRAKVVHTLFFTGPVIREWGFACPKGWKHWKEFVSATASGNKVGKGCND